MDRVTMKNYLIGTSALIFIRKKIKFIVLRHFNLKLASETS